MIVEIKELTDFFIRVFLILIISFLAYFVGRKAIYHLYNVQKKSEKQRAANALLVLKNLWKYVVFFISLMMILSSFSGLAIPAVAITAVIASTLGFGAQSLLKDIVAGFSMIFEGQLGIGDIVYLQGLDIEGRVKEIGLRISVFQDADGNTWYVPNGEIKAVKKISAKKQIA